MIKFICLLSALAAVSNASFRTDIYPSVNVIQGTNATGVIVKKKGTSVEVTWEENFDSKNSMKIYFNYMFEDTGLRRTTVLDNLCAKYEPETYEYNVKHFVLQTFGNTNRCPIKKGVKRITLPVTYPHPTQNKICGPIFAMLNIFRNNETDPGVTPLLIGATLRGKITGSDC